MRKTEKEIAIQEIQSSQWQEKQVRLQVLRLDEWHPVVSGNKWFKLQFYLSDAIGKGHTAIATFGGAYSNHIVATAFACREQGLDCLGVIRGEQAPQLSHTLRQAQAYGMQLQFVSRGEYRNKTGLQARWPQLYWIDEGGYGVLGAKGIATLAGYIPGFADYTHLVCAVGTGTTLAGLVKMALPHQTVTGISVLKNHYHLEHEVQALLSGDEKNEKRFVLCHEYHFGGYAKPDPALIAYANEVWQQHSLPLDFVYTAKAFYAMESRLAQGFFPAGSRVLFIHTGGLQGNLSLPAGVLSF